jgi:hypothetical protein
MTPKINLTDLRRIVREELKLNEAVDHAAIRDIVTDASKLLAAVEAFNSTASESAKNALVPHIDKIEKVLEDMVSTPGSYVAKPKLVPKKVTLRQVKSEGNLRESSNISTCAKTIHGFIKGENKDKKSAVDAFNTLQSKGVIKSKASLGSIARVMNDLSKGKNVDSEDLQDADSALSFLI